MRKRYQVFISSTYNDLIPERQAAVSAILKAGHIPAGMELFTAADRTQMATITQWIDESDVYMLILGGRYGTVEASSGLGYTEIEYDYAKSQGKPLFAVVINDEALERKVKTIGTEVIERDNVKQYRAFKEKVLSNISSFFEDPKDIRLCVHESLADFAANRNLKGWVSVDEIEDTKPLYDEIRVLTEENRALRSELSQFKTEAPNKPTVSNEKGEAKKKEKFSELMAILSKTTISIPKDLNHGKDAEARLLDIFYGNKESLANGVTNAFNSPPTAIFLFFNICPRLQIHGLTVSEKVNGVQYRRYALTDLGRELLADIDKQMILSKKQSVAQDDSIPKSKPLVAPLKSPPARRIRSKGIEQQNYT